MRRISILILILLFVGTICSCRPDQSEAWWQKQTAPGKKSVLEVRLAARTSRTLQVAGSRKARLGIAVKQVDEMRHAQEASGVDTEMVFLTQTTTGDHVGTTYSAGYLFDLSAGADFVVENRSSIDADILVFEDEKL